MTQADSPSPSQPLDDDAALRAARRVARDWADHPYYDRAENDWEHQWHHLVWPFIEHADFRRVLDLGAGHGRNAARLRGLAERLYVVDPNEENIRHCRRRLGDDAAIVYLPNSGCDLRGVPDDEVTFLFCFDAMVHFPPEAVRAYLPEIARVLYPSGMAFCHYSNYDANPGADYRANPCWRNWMNRATFESLALEAGLRIVRTDVLDWGGHRALDCFSLLQKPWE